MTEVNKEELRRLAEATGGITWVASHATSHQGQRTSRSIYHYPTPYHCVEIIETPDSDPENKESIREHSAWGFIGAANPAAVLSLLDENDQLRAEVEALRKDAERYRWLRTDGDAGDHSIVLARMYQVDPVISELRCEVADYDQAVDAAMVNEGGAND